MKVVAKTRQAKIGRKFHDLHTLLSWNLYTGYKEAKVGLYRKRRRGVGWRVVIGLLGRSVLNECLEKIKQKQTLKKKQKQKQAVNLPYSGRTVKSLSFGTFVTNLELVIVTFCDDIPCHDH